MSNQRPFKAKSYQINTSSRKSKKPPQMIGSIISGIAGLGQSFLQRGQDKKNIAAQAKHNLELAKYSRGQDLEQWHRANAFNSPEANMARLKKAGLNPNLVYGTGSATQLASEMPKYSQEATEQAISAPQIGQGINAYQQYRQGEANIRLTDQHTATSGAGQRKIEAEIPNISTSEGRKVEQHQQDLANKRAINANSVQQLANAKLDAKYKTMQNEIKAETKKFEKLGISPTSQAWINVIDKILQKFNFSILDWLNPTGQKPDNVSLNRN